MPIVLVVGGCGADDESRGDGGLDRRRRERRRRARRSSSEAAAEAGILQATPAVRRRRRRPDAGADRGPVLHAGHAAAVEPRHGRRPRHGAAGDRRRASTPSAGRSRGALLDFWQADADGEYDNDGYRLRGHQFADGDGPLRACDTIVPGLYPGRTRHIHVKVQRPHGQILTTQLYFPGEPRNRTDGIFDARCSWTSAGAGSGRRARFRFVLT